MSLDWYPGIRAFCQHWSNAPMLQETYAAFEREFEKSNDACIDAAKGIVECACRVMIESLDDPSAPLKPSKQDTSINELVGIVVRLLRLGDSRDRKFADLIKQHNKLADALRELRNDAGNVSHGKDGFITKLSTHHQRAAVLAADAIVTFLHEAHLATSARLDRTKEPYERFTTLHAIIDRHASLQLANDDDHQHFILIVMPDRTEIAVPILASQLLFEYDRSAYVEALRLGQEADCELSKGFSPVDLSSDDAEGDAR